VQENEKVVSPLETILTFVFFTAYFYLLLFTLLPFLKAAFNLHPAIYWFVTGYFLFVPLLMYAVLRAWAEGHRGMGRILAALNIKPFSKRDWRYSILGLLLGMILTGVIFALSLAGSKYLGWRPLSTTPWFMEMRPFAGTEKLLLLVWLPMFFFNIVGEELLWRGYLQSRLHGRYAWPLCSALWLLFHLPFGPGLMIMLLPVVVIIPFAFHKTRNTLVGIFIHGMYNGPMFVAVAMGWIG
jgi:membrane protease YdiL (CAAX protease family)